MPNLNVELSEEEFVNLRKMKAELSGGLPMTWPKFFKKLFETQIEVEFDMLKIDEDGSWPEGADPPMKHTAVFKIGDYVYRYENGVTVLFQTPIQPSMIKRAMVNMFVASAV